MNKVKVEEIKDEKKKEKKEEINNQLLLDIGLDNNNKNLNNIFDLSSEKNNNLNKGNNEEKLISIIILSEDENILYSIICKKTDKLKDIEAHFYEIFPDYKNTYNFFIFKKIKLDKVKDLDENKISF